jgi:type I restriction enzyme M protein
LQNENVVRQIVRLSTGSSSSRARVQSDDLLNEVYIPILNEDIQKKISDSLSDAMDEVWGQAQKLLTIYESAQHLLGSKVSKDDLRSI